MGRYACFRFDIDTDLCLRSGVPKLLELGQKTGALFTFFATPGRAISRQLAFRGLCRRWLYGSKRTPKTSLTTLDKLGGVELVRLLAMNPNLLPSRGHILRTAHKDGHEIGLHGGRNHGIWQVSAHDWSPTNLANELDFGVHELSIAIGEAPCIFASPGWNSPSRLPDLLASRGFDAIADTRGLDTSVQRYGNGLLSLPTTLTGEPGGVGYLEWHRAKRTSDDGIVNTVRRHLDGDSAIVCMYDHPFYAGCREISLLERIIKEAQDSGRTILPLAGAARQLAATPADASR